MNGLQIFPFETQTRGTKLWKSSLNYTHERGLHLNKFHVTATFGCFVGLKKLVIFEWKKEAVFGEYNKKEKTEDMMHKLKLEGQALSRKKKKKTLRSRCHFFSILHYHFDMTRNQFFFFWGGGVGEEASFKTTRQRWENRFFRVEKYYALSGTSAVSENWSQETWPV